MNRILMKIMQCGWQDCDLPELAVVHQEVSSATDKLIRRCEICCGSDGKKMITNQAQKINQEETKAKMKACDLTYRLNEKKEQEERLYETMQPGIIDLSKKVKSPCELEAERITKENRPRPKLPAETQCIQSRHPSKETIKAKLSFSHDK